MNSNLVPPSSVNNTSGAVPDKSAIVDNSPANFPRTPKSFSPAPSLLDDIARRRRKTNPPPRQVLSRCLIQQSSSITDPIKSIRPTECSTISPLSMMQPWPFLLPSIFPPSPFLSRPPMQPSFLYRNLNIIRVLIAHRSKLHLRSGSIPNFRHDRIPISSCRPPLLLHTSLQSH